MPEWGELARFARDVGFPAVMALLVWRQYIIMHRENRQSIDALAMEIVKLRAHIAALHQWLEQTRWNRAYGAPPPDFPRRQDWEAP